MYGCFLEPHNQGLDDLSPDSSTCTCTCTSFITFVFNYLLDPPPTPPTENTSWNRWPLTHSCIYDNASNYSRCLRPGLGAFFKEKCLLATFLATMMTLTPNLAHGQISSSLTFFSDNGISYGHVTLFLKIANMWGIANRFSRNFK